MSCGHITFQILYSCISFETESNKLDILFSSYFVVFTAIYALFTMAAISVINSEEKLIEALNDTALGGRPPNILIIDWKGHI